MPNRETISYNIHNILSFRINRPKCRDFIKDINLPYSYFETEHLDKPDIILNIGKFTPQNRDCHVVDHKWYVKKDYIYRSERVGNIRFNIEITGLETSPAIINVSTTLRQFKQLFYPSVLPQYIVLRPMIDFKLLCKGFLSVHAAAVADGNGAFIFPGRGGTFKTTLLMDFVRKHNCKLLGDDRVIIYKNNVLSYPVHRKLLDYRIQKMRTEEYSLLDKYRYVLYQKLNHDVSGSILPKSTISSFYSVAKSNGREIKLRKISKKDVLSKIIHSHKMETMCGPVIMGISKGLYDYFTAYSYVFGDSKIAHYWDMYESLLNEYLKADEYYELSLPYKYTKTTFDDFINTVKALK